MNKHSSKTLKNLYISSIYYDPTTGTTCYTHTHTIQTLNPKSGHFCDEMFTQLGQVNVNGQAPTVMAARHNMV